VPQRGLHVGIAQHPRDFLNPPLALDNLHIARRHATLLPLRNPDVVVGVGSDLRQVRNHQGLAVGAGKTRQCLAHPDTDLTTDALIHLVEDEGRHRVMRREHHFQREHQPRQLPA